MMRIIRSELVRLKNPNLILGGIGLMAFFGLMSTAVVFFTASSGSSALPNTEDITSAMIETPDGMVAGLRYFVGMLGVVAFVVWAMAATSDVSSGLIRLLVQAEPNRLRLLAGKVVALTLFTCVATLVTTAMVLPIAPGLASGAGISTAAWSLEPATIGAGYLQLTLSVLLWGVVGLFVGVVTRSAGISIAIGIGYLMVFEGLMAMLLESASKWLPGATFAALAMGGTPDMAYATALFMSAAYAGAALVAAALVFTRRDITA